MPGPGVGRCKSWSTPPFRPRSTFHRRGGAPSNLPVGVRFHPDLPEHLGLVLGEEIFHHHLVRRRHPRILEDDAEAGLAPGGSAGVPDLDERACGRPGMR